MTSGFGFVAKFWGGALDIGKASNHGATKESGREEDQDELLYSPVILTSPTCTQRRAERSGGQICAALCIRDWEQNGCTLLSLALWGKFLLCPPLASSPPPFVLHCFECAKASRGSAPLGGGFGKCEEKWARLLVRRNETGPGRLGNDLVSELTLTGQRTILDDCDCSRHYGRDNQVSHQIGES